MKDFWNWIQLAIATLGGSLGWMLGGFDGFLYVLILFVVLDFITGVMRAVVDKALSSQVSFRGIFKKLLIFVMVAVAHMIDTHIIGRAGSIRDYSAVRTATVFFYLANEGLSLLENAAYIGLPIPDRLKGVLAQLHGKTDPTDGGE